MGRLIPTTAELVTGLGWGVVGVTALALSWGCIRFAKSMIAYRRWRAKLERSTTEDQ
jgi:hypothetical protein